MEFGANEKISKREIAMEIREGSLALEEGGQVRTTGEENSENSVTKKHSKDSLPNYDASITENKFRIPSFLLEKREQIESEVDQNLSGKRKRKSKKEISGRDFTCPICKKSYLSYPALYTHRRNKHNIIPITGKPEIFKSNQSNLNTKFKYNALETTNDNSAITKVILKIYQDLCKKYFCDPESILHKEYNFDDDSFIQLVQFYHDRGMEKTQIPKPDEDGDYVDNVLVVYLILILEVTREKFYAELIVKFVFLFREFLNNFGWEYKKYLNGFGLIDDLKIDGEFCKQSNCEELPELVNDFISVFLELQVDATQSKVTDIIDICQNFCYWLLINNLTPYKLCKIDGHNY